ncbi:Hypothetical protein A7982_09586 [Minicystis rosea]|nr:Hypothetical protein A7982_09586 [Minicystis rosea]
MVIGIPLELLATELLLVALPPAPPLPVVALTLLVLRLLVLAAPPLPGVISGTPPPQPNDAIEVSRRRARQLDVIPRG